jgi:hypothetical protein
MATLRNLKFLKVAITAFRASSASRPVHPAACHLGLAISAENRDLG